MIIEINWFNGIKLIENNNELNIEGLNRAAEMLQKGYIEGELFHLIGRKHYTGWFKINIMKKENR